MRIKTFTFNPFSTNCFIASSEGEAVIVDPSCQSEAEIAAVLDYVQENDLTVNHLVLTHAHIDHIFGCAALSEALALGIRVHAEDVPLLENAERQAEMFGIPIQPVGPVTGRLLEGEQIQTGSLLWEIIHTPGHSPGSVSFIDREHRYVIAGDVLFRGSIGRTDLWKGSLPVLMASIFQKIVPLGEDFTVYPGHGPATTVRTELDTNPFLSGAGMPGL